MKRPKYSYHRPKPLATEHHLPPLSTVPPARQARPNTPLMTLAEANEITREEK